MQIVLPYERISPVHIPRRDLVLGAADSLYLQVSVVQSDSPASPPIELTGGIGGPALRMYVWPDTIWRHHHDYGAPPASPGSVLWSALATIHPTMEGTYVVAFPPGTMARWPCRCGFSLQLEWISATQVAMLAHGILHVQQGAQTLVPPAVITTDPAADGSTLVLGA